MDAQVGCGPQHRVRERDGIESSPEFIQIREQCPLQARLVLAFFSFADDAIEDLIVRRDMQAALESVSKMQELSTWLTNTAPHQ